MSGRTLGADPSLPRRNWVCPSPQAGHEGGAKPLPPQPLLPIPPGMKGTVKTGGLVTVTGCQFVVCMHGGGGQCPRMGQWIIREDWYQVLCKTFHALELTAVSRMGDCCLLESHSHSGRGRPLRSFGKGSGLLTGTTYSADQLPSSS